MELLDYLYAHFYSEAQLTKYCDVTKQRFTELQALGVMPKPSYILNAHIGCRSFFGNHEQNADINFYPKTYKQWLNKMKLNKKREDAFHCFNTRMQQTIQALSNKGISSNYKNGTKEQAKFIEIQWQHFLEGTYGLCTRTGLPEDIAKKEITIDYINMLLAQQKLNDKEEKQLICAMNILTSCSPKFAPHERSKSQFHQLAEVIDSTTALKQTQSKHL
ncbi:hypothetical protein N480_21405 [Pseudoalteromonas luteoviolacea S2607]|uniref:DUF6058 family natural product biosynthesis protein n=1 Tax=Pseudoalteromonas luteoviolacea TaxID=43657 RepID=UPI0007B07C03|nr:DUF6058 family natural product biosynthesis protein [Pseudoalteromonas luteoviolacea]KZN34585.1 hypothetical protein N480_21405 [Pseudoalteromonas luteoviolacea S2607]